MKMIYDFIVIGPEVGKAIKMKGSASLSEVASEAAATIERETGKTVDAAIYLPGDRSFEELAKVELGDVIKPGAVSQIFVFD